MSQAQGRQTRQGGKARKARTRAGNPKGNIANGKEAVGMPNGASEGSGHQEDKGGEHCTGARPKVYCQSKPRSAHYAPLISRPPVRGRHERIEGEEQQYTVDGHQGNSDNRCPTGRPQTAHKVEQSMNVECRSTAIGEVIA